ncbi:hypothetical protein ACLOJK_036263 [Asimina triloba]
MSVPRLWTMQGPGMAAENRRAWRRLAAAERASFHILQPAGDHLDPDAGRRISRSAEGERGKEVEIGALPTTVFALPTAFQMRKARFSRSKGAGKRRAARGGVDGRSLAERQTNLPAGKGGQRRGAEAPTRSNLAFASIAT